MQKKYDYVFKISLLGSSSVGKSSILKRYADDEFDSNYISTIGIDFRFKSVMIDNNYVKLQIWDTAGQQRFRGITKSYYKGCSAIILVYDINNQKGFDDIMSYWLNQAQANIGNSKIYVFVNKCDNPDIQIKQSQLSKLEQKKLQVFKVSAKTGAGVAQYMTKIVKELMEMNPKVQQSKTPTTIHQSAKQRVIRKTQKCCPMS